MAIQSKSITDFSVTNQELKQLLLISLTIIPNMMI